LFVTRFLLLAALIGVTSSEALQLKGARPRAPRAPDPLPRLARLCDW